jgi:ribosomal protein L35
VPTIKIVCRFKEYPHLICDETGQFWILPHQSGKKYLPLKKVTPVTHAKKPHINYKNHRISIKSLREKAVVVEEDFKVVEKKLPF